MDINGHEQTVTDENGQRWTNQATIPKEFQRFIWYFSAFFFL